MLQRVSLLFNVRLPLRQCQWETLKWDGTSGSSDAFSTCYGFRSNPEFLTSTSTTFCRLSTHLALLTLRWTDIDVFAFYIRTQLAVLLFIRSLQGRRSNVAGGQAQVPALQMDADRKDKPLQSFTELNMSISWIKADYRVRVQWDDI